MLLLTIAPWFAPLAERWLALGPKTRIGVAVAAGLFLTALVVSLLRRWLRGKEHGLLVGIALVGALFTLGLGAWSFALPNPLGGRFILSHQVVRVGAALSATVTGFAALSLAVPYALNFFEGSSFVSFMAARHVRSKKSGFLTIISFLSIAGVAVSSFALCAVVSIMGGFGADLKNKILDNNAHIRVESEKPGGFEYWNDALDKVSHVPGVAAATPVAGGEAMASSSTNTAGVLLRGIDTQTIGQVIEVPNRVEVGDFKYLNDPAALRDLPADAPIGLGPSGEMYLKGPDMGSSEKGEAYPAVVLGRELAKSLHVYVGDVLTLVSPLGDLGPMGLMPRTRKFRVGGIFYSGMYEYDASHAYVAIAEAQKFLDLSHFVTGIEIRVHDVENVQTVTPLVREALSRKDLRVRDWKELNKNLFGALQLEKVMTFVILSIAIAVASFCIICTLLLLVTEKSKEIAILKAMGASDRAVLNVFMAEGMFIGGVGTVFGVVTGFIAMQGLKTFGVRLDPEVYYVDRLPVNVQPLDYVLVALCAFVITTLATLYPAAAASSLRPVDGIRYE
jgi:lipoprotein-releasing system permease protein